MTTGGLITRSFVRLVGVLCLIVILAACEGLGGEPVIVATQLPATSAPADRGYPLDPPDLALGASLFAQRCAACHGESGRGDGELVLAGQIPPPPDFTDPETARAQRPSDWFMTITHGRIENGMPPWAGALTEDERWAVAMFTYTMATTQGQLEQGGEVHQASVQAGYWQNHHEGLLSKMPCRPQ